MTAKPKNADIKNLSFEEAIEELESIVSGFESGKVELEEAIEQYTRGAALKEYCEKKLKDAKLKVEKISQNNDKISTSSFDE